MQLILLGLRCTIANKLFIDEEWETVQGIGFKRHYVKKVLFGATSSERVNKCKLFCLKNDIALNKSSPKLRSDSDFVQCVKWGFSYKFVGAGRIECRYPVAPWKHKKQTKCIEEKKNVVVIQTVNILECMQICLRQQDCKQFSTFRSQTKARSLASPRRFTCHIYINTSPERTCNIKKRAFTLYYVQDRWMSQALIRHERKRARKNVKFTFVKKDDETAKLQAHLLSMLSTLSTRKTKTQHSQHLHVTRAVTSKQEDLYSFDKLKTRNFHIAVLVAVVACTVICFTCCVFSLLLYKLKKSVLSIGDLTQHSSGKNTIQNLSTRNIVSSKIKTRRVLAI